jgi:hypothetical protein
MVIVVPALAHREEGGEPNVAALYRRAANFANQFAVVMREVADQPMPENGGGDVNAVQGRCSPSRSELAASQVYANSLAVRKA